LSIFFNISKYNILVEGAYAPGSRIEFPPTPALPNIWQELAAIFLVKNSLAKHLANYLQEFVSGRAGYLLGAKILATNQTMTNA
jgi:hypothetical protein